MYGVAMETIPAICFIFFLALVWRLILVIYREEGLIEWCKQLIATVLLIFLLNIAYFYWIRYQFWHNTQSGFIPI
jgi:hypothetical protein